MRDKLDEIIRICEEIEADAAPKMCFDCGFDPRDVRDIRMLALEVRSEVSA